MKTKIEELTAQEMQAINGGDGIIAYDPRTGEPFPEENGGYPVPDPDNDGPTKNDMGRSAF